MKRLGKKSEHELTTPRFEVLVSFVRPIFQWKRCNTCGYEFKRENGIIIELRENNVLPSHIEYHYLCEDCCRGKTLSQIKNEWEQGMVFSRFIKGREDI